MTLSPYRSTHIVQITDTTDANASLKIQSAYAKHLGACGLRDAFVTVAPSTNTLDIGIKASELVHNSERPDRLLLALNCAPPDKADGTKDNHRRDFYFAYLGDEIYAGGTVNGLELSYLKGRIKELFRLATTNALGSQFRSLQVLPEHIVRFSLPETRARLIEAGALRPVENIDDVIRSVPDRTHVIEVDNFKNVKLFPSSTHRRWLDRADRIVFEFGQNSIEFDSSPQSPTQEYSAIVRDKLFDAPVGTNIIARISSSVISGSDQVPMIATIRPRPAETLPDYQVPKLGSLSVSRRNGYYKYQTGF